MGRVFLSPEDLSELTGRQTAPAQIRWLREQRIPFLIGADGKPKVLRSTILAMLGGVGQTVEPRLRLA